MLWADDSFISTWGDSSVFVLLANGKDTEPKAGRKKRWFVLTLLVLMIVGLSLIHILIKKLLPQEKTTVMKAQARMLPAISFVSAFLNNTPVVVIFAPIIKRWAESVRIPATKFLIPLSYATILGGMCTLIGTSTNLVVDGMILAAGYKGFGMFELGRVGIFIALAGVVYLLFLSLIHIF